MEGLILPGPLGLVGRLIVEDDRPAPDPMNCSRAGVKSPVDRPVQVEQRQHLGDLG